MALQFVRCFWSLRTTLGSNIRTPQLNEVLIQWTVLIAGGTRYHNARETERSYILLDEGKLLKIVQWHVLGVVIYLAPLSHKGDT